MLTICSLSLFTTYLDSSVLNVALPSIERDFHAGIADLQWVADAYLLVLASLLMLSGSVADRFGRRRFFTTGLLLFTLGSALCSLAPDVGALIVFRMAQALGGCLLIPTSLAIVRQVYTEPAERARAMGIWSAAFGIGVATGPVLGGILVTGIGWRAVFWINIPVGLAAWYLARRHVPESRAGRTRQLDPPGQVLVIVGLGALTYGIIEGPSSGWASPQIVGLFAAAAVATAALLVLERRRAEPLIELHFFRSPPFSAAVAVAVMSFLALSGFLFVSTLYLQDVRGDSALVAGVSLLPATVVIAVSSVPSGRVLGRLGPRVPLVASGTFIAAGGALLAGLAPTTGLLRLAVAYAVLGCGFGIVNPPITNTAVSGMPPDQAGVASAIASTFRQLGNVLGVAVMGSIVSAAAIGGRLGGSGSLRFTDATHLAWAVVIACGVASALTALVLTGPRGMGVAARVYQDEPTDLTGRGGTAEPAGALARDAPRGAQRFATPR